MVFILISCYLFSKLTRVEWYTVHSENSPQRAFHISTKPKIFFGDIPYVDLIDVNHFRIEEYVGMLEALGLGDRLFSHFRNPEKSLDDGLVPLMSVEDVVQLFKYVPHFKEIEVYIEEGISSVEEYSLYMRNSRGKGVVIEDIEDGDVVKQDGELFLLEWHGATEIGKEGKQGETSTHASSSRAGSRDDENFLS